MYLDTGIQFWPHKNIFLEKDMHAEDRVRRQCSTYSLKPGLIRQVQVATVQAVALYTVEILWYSQKGLYEEYEKLVNKQG